MKSIYLSPSELLRQDFETVSEAYENYMLLKNYSQSTVKTYLCKFRKYNQWCVSQGIQMIYDQDHVKAYLPIVLSGGRSDD